jgi:hypothetical protein
MCCRQRSLSSIDWGIEIEVRARSGRKPGQWQGATLQVRLRRQEAFAL